MVVESVYRACPRDWLSAMGSGILGRLCRRAHFMPVLGVVVGMFFRSHAPLPDQ